MRAYSGAGQVLGHLAEDARLAARLGLLDRVPVAQDLAGVLDLDVAEDVRVAADELLAAVLGDVGQRAGAALLEQQREEVDLEEDVAELVEQLGVVAPVGGVGQLVGLLERVRDDRALVLLAVPRALDAAGAASGRRARASAWRRRFGGVIPGESTNAWDRASGRRRTVHARSIVAPRGAAMEQATLRRPPTR